MGQITDKLYDDTYNKLIEQGATNLNKQQVLHLLDNYFKGFKKFTTEGESIKIERLGKFIYDPDAKDKREKFKKKAQEEIDKVLKEKGIVAKKDIKESLDKAGVLFANIKKF